MKKFLYGLVILVVIAFVAAFIFAKWPTSTTTLAVDAAQLNTPEMIAKGEYLARLGDCSACHSPKGKAFFAGGTPLQSPIGVIYGPNITPDETTGIGLYSLNDFARAVRAGIRNDGVTLYPAMPYPSFANLSDDDVSALYAYFHYGVKAVKMERQANTISWPLSIRWPLAIWRKLYAPTPAPFDASQYASAQVARGAYIVQGLGHCGTCHTPRALTLQEKGLNEKSPYYLAGGTLIEGWATLSLRNSDNGLKNWSVEDIVQSLSTGRNDKSVVIGTPMNDFVHQSGRFFSNADLLAVAAYLKTLPAQAGDQAKYEPKNKAVAVDYIEAAYLYQKNCSACHGPTGKGIAGLFPALSANPIILSDNPQSVIRVVLSGFKNQRVNNQTLPLAMPAMGEKLSDSEIADVINFIRNNWGNKAGLISEKDVSRVRNQFGPTLK